MSTDRLMNKNNCFTHTHTYIYTVEYYVPLKKKNPVTHPTWINLEGIMISEISQTQKDTHCMITDVES